MTESVDLDRIEEELDSVESKCKVNIKMFNTLVDSVKSSPILNIISPTAPGHFKKIKHQYQEEQNKCLKTIEKYQAEYNSLLEEMDRLQCENNKTEMKISTRKIDIEKMNETLKTIKKQYNYEKNALKTAKAFYEVNFGMDAEVETEGDDEYQAVVNFNEGNFSVRFNINRASKNIIDFDTGSFLPEEESENLTTEFGQSSNPLELLCALKDVATDRENINN